MLSDRDSDRDLAPIPSLLLTSAVHHHLIREKTRTQVGLLVEAGDVREVHHVALLVGYGAAAINPYLAMETVEDMVRRGAITEVTEEKAVANLIKALGKGVLKVMSKMGISTVASYRGAQVFEAIGLSQDLVDEFFTGTVSQLGGVGLDVIAAETPPGTRPAYPPDGIRQRAPQAPGRRRVPVAPRGRAAPVRPGDGLPLQHATDPAATTSSSSTPAGSTSRPAADDPARALRARRGEPPPGADRRGRAGQPRSSSGSTPVR